MSTMKSKRLAFLSVFFSIGLVGVGSTTYAQSNNGYHRVAVIDGHSIWVNILSKSGKEITWKPHQAWWRNGNTVSDEYLFAINAPSNLKMKVQFSKINKGRVMATFSTGQSTQVRPGMQRVYTLATRSGQWFVKGKVNYNLSVNQFAGNKLLWTTQVGQELPGIPQWQSGSLVAKKSEEYGVARFEGTVRLPNAPTYRVQPPVWPTFPYLGFGEDKNVNWFVQNPSPVYFDLKTDSILQFPFVGFEEAGMYRFNSLTYAPAVDFESPFAFYNYIPNSRYAQEVIRAQQFPKKDPYAPEHVNRQQSYFRLSWKMDNPYLWRYSLEVQGFHAFRRYYKIGSVKVYAPKPMSYGDWVGSKSWPYVSFVQAMNGYSGSEGIYFDSGGTTSSVWPWLDGLTNRVPSYLAHPHLVAKATMTSVTSESLPIGYRIDSNAAYFQKPQLYISNVDHLVHLWGATQGLENLGNGSILRFENLDDGNIFDGWVRETSGGSKEHASHVTSQLYDLGHYLIYAGKGMLEIVKTQINPVVARISVPTNKTTWQKYVTEVKPYENGRDPWDLHSWIERFSGLGTTLSSATLSHVQVTRQGLVGDLIVNTDNTTKGLLSKAIDVRSGHYVLRYNAKSERWTIARGAIPDFSASVRIGDGSALHSGKLYKVTVDIANDSGVPLPARVQLRINGKSTLVRTIANLSSTDAFSGYIRFPSGVSVAMAVVNNGKIIYYQHVNVFAKHRLANAYLYRLSNESSSFGEWLVGSLGFGISALVAAFWLRIRKAVNTESTRRRSES